jgi:uncharacterized membrane-anchored protein
MASIYGNATVNQQCDSLVVLKTKLNEAQTALDAIESTYTAAHAAMVAAPGLPGATSVSIRAAYDAVVAAGVLFLPVKAKYDTLLAAWNGQNSSYQKMCDGDAQAQAAG